MATVTTQPDADHLECLMIGTLVRAEAPGKFHKDKSHDRRWDPTADAFDLVRSMQRKLGNARALLALARGANGSRN